MVGIPVRSYTYADFLRQCGTLDDTLCMRTAVRSALCHLASLSVAWCAKWPSYQKLQKQTPCLHDDVLIPLPLSYSQPKPLGALDSLEWPAKLGFLTTEWPAKMCFLVLMNLLSISVETTIQARMKHMEETLEIEGTIEPSPLVLIFDKGRSIWSEECLKVCNELRKSLPTPTHIPRAFFAWFLVFTRKAEDRSLRVCNQPLVFGIYPPTFPFSLRDDRPTLDYDADTTHHTTYHNILYHVMERDWTPDGMPALGRRLLSWSALLKQGLSKKTRTGSATSVWDETVETGTATNTWSFSWETLLLERLALELEVWPHRSCTQVWSLTELQGLSYLAVPSHCRGLCLVYHQIRVLTSSSTTCLGLWVVDMQTKQHELYVTDNGNEESNQAAWRHVEHHYANLGILQSDNHTPRKLPPSLETLEPALAFLHLLRNIMHQRTLVIDECLPIKGDMGQGLTMELLTNLAHETARSRDQWSRLRPYMKQDTRMSDDVAMEEDIQVTFHLYLSSLGLGTFVGPNTFATERTTTLERAEEISLPNTLQTKQLHEICKLILTFSCHGYSVRSLERRHLGMRMDGNVCFTLLPIDEVTTVAVPCRKMELETFALKEFHVMLVSLATSLVCDNVQILDSPWWSGVEAQISRIQTLYAEPGVQLRQLFLCLGLVDDEVWGVCQTPIDIHLQTHIFARCLKAPESRSAIFERAYREAQKPKVQGAQEGGVNQMSALFLPKPRRRLTGKQPSSDYPQDVDKKQASGLILPKPRR